MSTTSLTFSSQTGHIFGVVLACFVSLPYCSLLSVLAHLALCLLCAVVGVRVYTIVMVKAGKVEAGVDLLACVAIFRPAWISPDLLGRRHVVQLLRPPSAPRRMSSGRTPEGEPGSHQLMRSQEAHQAVSSVIAQVYNTDSQVSIAALGQLDKLMKDNDKVELIGPGSTSCSVCAASSTDTCCKPR